MNWIICYNIDLYIIGDNVIVKCKYNLYFIYYYISEILSINVRFEIVNGIYCNY